VLRDAALPLFFPSLERNASASAAVLSIVPSLFRGLGTPWTLPNSNTVVLPFVEISLS